MSKLQKFKVTLDRKVTVWERKSIIMTANSLEEAQEDLLNFDLGKDYKLKPEDIDYSFVEDSVEAITRRENLAMAEVDTLSLEYLTEEELSNYPVIEFPEEYNYKL